MKGFIKKLIMFTLVAMTLCGCNIINGNVASLLKAPAPNNMQTGLSLAIEQTIGGSIKYVTPVSGSYKKSFVLNDLDGDGRREAVVFFVSVDNAGLESLASFAVYASNEQGEWSLIKQIFGSGSRIDYVEFRDFTGDTRKELLVGWMQNETVKELCAYDIYSQSDKAIFSDMYNESRLLYDGYHLLVLNLYRDITTGKGSAKISTIAGNMLKTVSECEMYGGYDSIASIIYNKIRIDKKVIIVDARLGNSMITQVLLWEDGRLFNPYFDSETGVNSALIRETSYICQDIDGDGLTEVPFTTPLPAVPSAANVKDTSTAVVTGWGSLNLPEDNASVVLDREFFCVMNSAQKYYYIVPSEWIGKFSCTYNAGDQSHTFYYFDGESFSKMFSLYGLTEEQYNARKEQGSWLELRKGQSKVYAMNTASELNTETSVFMGNMSQNRERLIIMK